MRPYILAEANWNDIKDARFELAVLPWGATEAHNYHLPYATDIIETELIAAEAARIAREKGAGVIVLPAVPFGVNTGQADICLDMNLNPGTQFLILKDIVEVLHRHNIHRLLLLNGHGGNDFKPFIRELGLKFPEMFLCTADWYKALDRNRYFENPGDHADEMETSLMLYLRPDLVLPGDKWGKGKEKKNRIASFSEGWLWTERKWSKVSEDTGIGDPRLASREKGAAFFKDITEKIGEVLYEISKTDPDKLYE